MDRGWIWGAAMGAVAFVAGRLATGWVIRRALRSARADVEGSWQNDLREQMRRDGERFQANVYFSWSAGAIGLGVAIASAFGAATVWIGLVGLATALFVPLDIAARVRYGTGKLSDRLRVIGLLRR